MHVTRPLFQIDPGWLFIVAGLALCVPGVLLPAKHDLFLLESQRDALAAKELHNNARLRTHVEFLHALEHDDPALVQRLVASQLNMVPVEKTPVLLAADPASAIGDWLDAAAEKPTVERAVWHETRLSELANGRRRLWLLSAGVLCVFIGLIMSAPASPPREESSDV